MLEALKALNSNVKAEDEDDPEAAELDAAANAVSDGLSFEARNYAAEARHLSRFRQLNSL